MVMIELNEVSKWYGEVIGVSHVSASISPGVTGLLGPNGAGKTTLLRMLTGQLRPDTGTIKIDGRPVWNNPSIFEIIGCCPDQETFYESLTGMEFLTFMARLNGLPKSKATERSKEALKIMGLKEDAWNKPVGAYSKGMRQRVKFAQAILHNPKVIFLDEPLSGMDPIGRHETVEMIRQFGQEGKTILVSSHILYEVEDMTSRILVLNNGLLLAEGDVHEIRELIDEQPRHVRIHTPDRQRLSSILVGCEEVQSLTFGDTPEELVVQTNSPDQFYNRFNQLVLDENIPVQQLVTLDDNLDSVFEYLVK